jgi:DNA repair protein RecO (recombination protein O)
VAPSSKAPEFSSGVVLRLTPYGDVDQVATLFTRAHGRITALARGARRSKKRFAGALGHLVVSQLGLRPRVRGDLWGLESAQIERDFTALAGDVAAFAHASYAIELLRELTPAEVAEPELLDLTIALHESLAAGGPSPAALRAFELALLETVGSAPVLDACASCGSIDLDGGGTVFDPGRGGVICPRCAPASRGPAVRPLSAAARAYLLAARAAPDLAAARGLDAPDEGARVDHAEARDAMLGMLTHLLGRPLRTVEFIGKVQSASRRREEP